MNWGDLKWDPVSPDINIDRIIYYGFDSGHEVCIDFCADGKYELTILKDGVPMLDTPITDDIQKHLTEEEVGQILVKIDALPKEDKQDG